MTKRFAIDEQTGKTFELIPERIWDVVAAIFSILYLIAWLVFFSWLLFDICIGRYLLIKLIIPEHAAIIKSPLFRLIAYTIIGGGIGGIINGIRGFIVWHPERMSFGWRFMWKNITIPLVGAILAGVVYAIMRGGIAAFGGSFRPDEDFTTQAFAAFAIGALSGYGSHKVFRWLDEQVNKLFKMAQIIEAKVPNLRGKSQQAAEAILREAGLKIGKLEMKVNDDPTKDDKIIDQNPPADSMIPIRGSVDITIAVKAK